MRKRSDKLKSNHVPQPVNHKEPLKAWLRYDRSGRLGTLKQLFTTLDRYRQIRCIALRVLQTSKGFWIFLFHQAFEESRS